MTRDDGVMTVTPCPVCRKQAGCTDCTICAGKGWHYVNVSLTALAKALRIVMGDTLPPAAAVCPSTDTEACPSTDTEACPSTDTEACPSTDTGRTACPDCGEPCRAKKDGGAWCMKCIGRQGGRGKANAAPVSQEAVTPPTEAETPLLDWSGAQAQRRDSKLAALASSAILSPVFRDAGVLFITEKYHKGKPGFGVRRDGELRDFDSKVLVLTRNADGWRASVPVQEAA